ncbi:hypothetical protein O3M35_006515 [Rhynocoris fuscipes]|uniref:Uncharacterized protein n=1 Tax=Rhynocoris fuscipes TaxID=488301 RepID=A0AAW1DJ20_9HEMI
MHKKIFCLSVTNFDLYLNNYCRYSDANFYIRTISLILITSKFQINRTNNVANRTAQSCKFCVHHILRTALASLKTFCIPA